MAQSGGSIVARLAPDTAKKAAMSGLDVQSNKRVGSPWCRARHSHPISVVGNRMRWGIASCLNRENISSSHSFEYRSLTLSRPILGIKSKSAEGTPLNDQKQSEYSRPVIVAMNSDHDFIVCSFQGFITPP